MSRPVADGLFTWPADEPRLIGSRCGECGVVTFPRQDGCPRCGAAGMARAELARRGVLWTWTTQQYLPKAPYAGPETEDGFGGFALGYVELPGEVKVEARLVNVDAASLRIGMEMDLVVVPFTVDPDGTEVVMFAFQPAAA